MRMRKKQVIKKPKAIKPYVLHANSKIPLIEADFHLVCTSDMEKLVNSKDFRDLFPAIERPWVDHGYYGITFYDYDRGRVIVMLSPNGMNHNVIHHEIHHATMKVGNHIGCSHDHRTSEEFYAQLAGYIGDFIYVQIEKWGLSISPYSSIIDPPTKIMPLH